MKKSHCVAALSIISFATAAADLPEYTVTDGTPWPFATSEVPQLTIAADLTLDRALDAVVIRGDQACLIYGPADTDALIPLCDGALDAARVAGGGVGGRDAVAVARGPAGVSVFTVDEQHELVEAVTTTLSIHAIAAADLDGQNGDDLLALADDGRTFHVLLSTHNPAAPFAPAGSFQSSQLVSQFTVGDLDADGSVEVIAATAVGLEFLRLDGTLVDALPSTGVTSAITASPDGRFVAWCQCAAPGVDDVLVIIDENGASTPLPLGSIGVCGASIADLDADGADDLVLSQRSTRQLMLLRNLSGGSVGGAFSTSPGQLALIDLDDTPTTPMPENATAPALADFDGDGDIDMLMPIAFADTHCVAWSDEVDAAALRAQFLGATYVSADDLSSYLGGGGLAAGGFGGAGTPSLLAGEGVLAVHLAPPTSPIPSDFGHLEVVVWRQEDDSQRADSTAVARIVTSIDSSWTSIAPLEILVPIQEPSFPSTAVYDVVLRLVATTSEESAGLTTALPAARGAFTTDPSTAQAYEVNDPQNYHLVLLYEPPIGGPIWTDAVEAGGYCERPATPILIEHLLLPKPTPDGGSSPAT